MAINHARETRLNEGKVVILAAANSDTKNSLADQNIAQYGTNRRSELIGQIGDTGQVFEKIYNDSLDGL